MINIQRFNSVVEAAKAKAINDPKWLRAIERAAREILSGEMIVSLFADDTALITTAAGQYRVNGRCACKAAQNGHTQCAHRAGKRLMATYEETAPVAVSTPARYCGDRDLQHLATCKQHITLADDVAVSTRQQLICEITNIWPRFSSTPL